MKHVTGSPAEKVLEAELLDLIQEYPQLLDQLREEYPELSLGFDSRAGAVSVSMWLVAGSAFWLAALGLGSAEVVGAAAVLGLLVVAVLHRLRSWRQAALDGFLNSFYMPGELAPEQALAGDDEAASGEGDAEDYLSDQPLEGAEEFLTMEYAQCPEGEAEYLTMEYALRREEKAEELLTLAVTQPLEEELGEYRTQADTQFLEEELQERLASEDPGALEEAEPARMGNMEPVARLAEEPPPAIADSQPLEWVESTEGVHSIEAVVLQEQPITIEGVEPLPDLVLQHLSREDAEPFHALLTDPAGPAEPGALAESVEAAESADSVTTQEPPEPPLTETPVTLPDDDPLTEADFHIAYGMYDQAAELLQAAIEQDPERRELRLKLLDVYFESGNKGEFLVLAQELVRTRYLADPGEREKIAIIGRQIAPKNPLFADSEDPHVAAAGMNLDLNLEIGEPQVDYDLAGTAQGRLGTSAITARAPDVMLAELEPVTMSEVGTKLDLARAYVNLGDPAGARSILEEVLSEGSLAQKQEAQQLLQALPG